ncbi:MAG: GatB/YqeY domain-containing protein [Hyphomicrobiaceae bacterium]
MLRQRLTEDMKTALKAGEKERLGVIRLMISAMKSADMEPGVKGEIDDAGIIAVLTRMVKQRRDSIEQYNAGGRPELAAKEAAEIAVIEAYLPRMMSEAETRDVIARLIAETGAAGPKDMGKVMGALKTGFAGQIDMGKASGLVKEMLAK